MYTNCTSKTGPVHKRRTLKVVSRVRLCIFITIILTLIISMFSFLLVKGKAQNIPDYYISWNVSRGDTLWKIAKESLPEGRDIRDYIAEIREYNSLDTSNIIEGQLLQIPIYDKEHQNVTKIVLNTNEN